MTASQARRLYNDARPVVNKKVIVVTDATTVSSTTIGDSGESWIPNEFAGQIMEITGNTGVGQTRRVVSNTATVLTVSPAFSTTPDTTSDFEVNPEALYGATNSVTAIGVTAEAPMGEARLVCAGTNSTSDTGGVTCYNHQAGPNVVADVFHGDSEQVDDSGAEWTGTDYDDIQSLDLSGRALVIGSMAHFYTETQDVRLGQGLDYLANQIFNTQNAVKNLGLQTLAGSSAIEVGFTGGADLAEYYTSFDLLEPGEVVAIDASQSAGVKRSNKSYQKDVLGVVATSPALILGTKTDDGYPIALTGRIPVKVTTENGLIKAGDQITSSAIPGYAMKATKPGRVLGIALEDVKEEDLSSCSEGSELKCGTVMMFVNLGNGTGETEDNNEIFDPLLFDIAGIATDSAVSVSSLSASTRRINGLTLNSLFVDGLARLDSLEARQATISADLRVKNNTLIEGILTVIGTLNSRDLIVNGLATFFGDVVFKGNVSFSAHPTFGSDTAGIAIVKKDMDRVEVVFDKEYEQVPVVNANISIEEEKETKGTQETKVSEAEKSVLAGDIRYVVTKRTSKGFTILLNKPATEDLTFSWIALSGRGGRDEISN
jgi:hypothetical protein